MQVYEHQTHFLHDRRDIASSFSQQSAHRPNPSINRLFPDPPSVFLSVFSSPCLTAR
ncbi:Uncharacterised protein [Vibrio cholerae]|nr:Uncharacterised protein [Vibrio cholerae]